jgi:hypothetical protein
MSLPCSSLNLRQLQPFGVALGEQGAQLNVLYFHAEGHRSVSADDSKVKHMPISDGI